ncbi:VWDE-like protein [Mya arenaria]|uniref:VWDE-like protein n=1 Tax=Mya arenaria TaxID=6604 RepID=A0ABY7ELN3_MYAAR|nr:VWDE-like protein [Mya arenaria]
MPVLLKYLFGVLFMFILDMKLHAFVSATCASKNATILDFLDKRLAGRPLVGDESAICDYYLTEKWYSMYNYTLASTPDRCGTEYNWYRKGSLPTKKNVEEALEMCRNGISGNCDQQMNTKAMLCDDGSYIFFLPYVFGCPEAYCIEDRDDEQQQGIEQPPNIDGMKKPVLEIAAVLLPNSRSQLEFYCDVSTSSDTSLFYTATYVLTTGTSVTDELFVSRRAQFKNTRQFREMVKMTEEDLQHKILRPLGITMACFIQASNTATSPNKTLSKQKDSDFKYIGIKCLNKSVTIGKGDTVKLYFESTVPFGCPRGGSTCQLPIELFDPTPSECHFPQPVQTMTTLIEDPREASRRPTCGLMISNKMKEANSVLLKSLPGHNRNKRGTPYSVHVLYFRTISSFPSHPLFERYQIEPVSVTINDTKPDLLNKQCGSYADPRIATFDGRGYSLRAEGTYILYKSTSLQQEIQTKTISCTASGTAFCNCGVAVRAGRDLYVIDLCDKKEPGSFRECEHGILIKEYSQNGHTKMKLPSGTEVDIYVKSKKYFDVYVHPSAEDYQHTEGLCGNFDGNPNNDESGSTIINWRVDGGHRLSLFDERNDKQLSEWRKSRYLCRCPTVKSQNIDKKIECHADTQKVCETKYDAKHSHRRCSSQRKRTKRDGTKHFKMVYDFYKSPKTAFVSHRGSLPEPEILSKRSVDKVYTKETAYTECMEVLNTTAYQMCSQIPGLNFSSFIEHCVLDAIDSNSMFWAQSHLEGIKSKCVYEVKAEQPPPPEAFEGMTFNVNGTTITFENDTKPNITFLRAETVPELSEENLKAIENIVCQNECSGNGKCENGTCECYAPFIGTDCSIDSSAPPEMLGIPDEGLCDLQQRPCNIIYVLADDFVDTENLTCKLTTFTVTPDSITYGDIVYVRAQIGGFFEVSCSIAKHRKKRSTISPNLFPNDVIATGYLVGISNTNETDSYSEEDSVVNFDTDCVQCSKINGTVSCETLPGFCVSDGRCYEVNETHQCLKCSMNSDETFSWQPGCENNTATLKPGIETVPTTGDDTWLILAIVSSVIGVLILVVGAVVVKRELRVTFKTLKSV